MGTMVGMSGVLTRGRVRVDCRAHRPWLRRRFGVAVIVGLVAAACSSGPEGLVRVGTPPPVEERIVSEPRPGFPEVEVTVVNNRFEPATIELGVGDLVNIVVVNNDDEAHDFYIDAPRIHTHPNHPVYIPVAAGGSASGELHAEAPGDFEIVCTLPGHAQDGHTAVLRVGG